MKNLLVIFVSILSIAPSVGRSAEATPISLSTKMDLAVDASSVQFRVDYPGLGANAVCSVGLNLSPLIYNTVDGLDEALIVEETFDQQLMPIKTVDSKTAVIKLKLGLYVTSFSISTRDGRTIREVLEDFGIYKGDLILRGRPCDSRSRARSK